MSTYTEEREFNLRVVMRRSFAEDYEGEEDGYVWAQALNPVLGDLITRALELLGSQSGWAVRTANRGLSSNDEVTIILER